MTWHALTMYYGQDMFVFYEHQQRELPTCYRYKVSLSNKLMTAGFAYGNINFTDISNLHWHFHCMSDYEPVWTHAIYLPCVSISA